MNNPNGSEEAIFHAARQLATGHEREVYVKAACTGDAALHRRVSELLASHAAVSGPLDCCLFGAMNDSTQVEPSVTRLGTEIGPYKLLQVIGEGGMGVVYMAEQTRPVRRKVALKVIKPGMDSQQVIARFEAERQALALMDHVNIARVLDAGMIGGNPKYEIRNPKQIRNAKFKARNESGAAILDAEESNVESDSDFEIRFSDFQPSAGRPYFVMELIHGIPITKYCDDNNLTPRQRLELFVPVCHAIQHAHQKGIIHRDIKPSNVMITLYDGKPVPKVIDFGVAKAIEQKLTERTLFTQYGTMVGTLEYMSPEQAEMSALGVDTRSDIYSLGVLLYELLTGSTPLSHKRMKEVGYAEILRLIKEVEPPRPSTRLSESGGALASISAQRQMEPAKLSQLMRGELDWIVMKTLEKDRVRRYDTANGLAADVLRYLNDEPVQACPPSARYRFQKFARRNSQLLATVSLVAFVLVAGTLVSAWQAIRATQAQGQANANYETAEEQRRQVQAQLLQTEHAKQQGLLRLFEARLSQARAGSLSRRAGQRFDSLEALSEATALARELKLPAEHDLQLRNAAIACLALSDLRLTKEWAGFPTGSTSIDFDGNLKHYARGDVKGAVSILRVEDDTEIASLPATGASAQPLFSRDGKFIATLSDKRVQVWSLVKPKPVLVFNLSSENVLGRDFLDFSFDNHKCVINQMDGVITVIDLVSGQPPRQLPKRVSGSHIAISNQEVAISCNNAVEIRDLHSGEVVATLQHPATVNELAWHPNGKILAVSCNGSQVNLWDTTTGKQVVVLEGFKSGGMRMAFSHSGDLLATTGWDVKMRLWDSQTGRLLFSTIGAGIPRFSADDRFLGTHTRDDKLGLLEIAECKEYRTFGHPSPILDLPYYNPSICGDGRLLAVGTNGGVGLWELSSGRELQFLELPGINFIAADSSGALLTNGASGSLRWKVTPDPSAPNKIRVGPPRELSLPRSLHDIACSRDGRVIASAQWTGGIVLHDDRPDRPVPLVPHDDVRYVSLSPDGKWAVTGSHGAVKIWNAESGKLLKDLPVLGWRGTFSPDGKWLATVLGGCKLWNVGTWEEGPNIGGGEGVAFSPDTSILAVETREGSIRLVEPNTGQEYARLEDPSQDRAKHITFSPDGTQLIATNDDSRSIHVWNLRLIRRQLAERGLDWNLPPYPPQSTEDSQPLSIEVDATIADKASATSGITFELGKLIVRGRQWTEKNKPQDEELKRFRAEAAELLGVN